MARLDSIHVYYVYLCDENDNPPIFNQTLYLVDLSENLNVGEAVYTFPKIDADFGSYCQQIDSQVTNDNYLLNITIISGDTSLFSTDNSLQAITLLSKLDFETVTIKQYDLTIEVDDLASPVQTIQTILRITLIDANDNAPKFQQTAYSIETDEGNYNPSMTIITVVATDTDSGLNGDVKYRIVGGNSLGLFSINLDSGDITTNGTKELDADPEDVIYVLTIEAYDLGTPEQTSSVTVTITVLNTNDNTPRFLDVNGDVIVVDSVSISENIPKNYLIYRTLANDRDGDLLYFSIISAPSNAYTIGTISGIVYSTSEVHCVDSNTVVNIIIQVRDREFINAKNSSLTLTINIEDVNNYAPEFCPASFAITAPSPLPANTDIGVLTPFDKDTCNTGFTFTITGGSDQASFTFNGDTLQTTASISFTQDDEFEIIVGVSDRGSTSVLVTTATIYIVLTQFVPIELEIENGYFTSLPTYTQTKVNQESNLFTQITPNLDGFISATLGTLSESYIFQHSPLPATNYKLDLIDSDVYADSKYLYIAIQRRTELKSTDISGTTSVELTASLGGQSETGTYSISSPHGITIMNLALPAPWFDISSAANANLGINFLSPTPILDTVSFSVNPYYSLPAIDSNLGNLILRLPQRTLYPGELFDIIVYGEAIGQELTNIDFSVTSSGPDIKFLDVDTISGWSPGFSSTDNTANIAAFKASTTAPVTDKRYLTVKARVENTISSENVVVVLSYSIVQLSNAGEQSVPLEPTRSVISRFGHGETGTLYLSRKQLAAVYASTATPHVLNTAVLNNDDVSLSYSAYAVIANTVPYIDSNINVDSCSGSASVFDIANPNCNALLTSSSVSTISLEELALTISVNDPDIAGTLTDIASYRVWTPSLSELVLEVTDSTLSVISNFEHSVSGTCLSVYQEAEIIATTNFQYPTGSPISVRVEQLIVDEIIFSPTDKVSRVGTKITGLSAGVTTLTYSATTVQVTTEILPVTVDRLNIIVATGLTFTNPIDPMYPVIGAQSVEVGYEQSLNRPALDAVLIAYAKFSDGSHRIVDSSSGVTFASTDSSVATVSGSILSIVGEGIGCYVSAIWSSIDSCSTPVVAQGEGFIKVEFDEPDELVVTLTETDIVYVSDEGSDLLPTETQITVRLIYGDVTIDMTSDPRTEYSFENSRYALDRSDCSINCIFTVQNGDHSGLATIRVKFSHITIFKEVSVNIYKSDRIEFSFTHEPDFLNSILVPVFPLNRISGTMQFQKASVSVQLNLVSGLTELPMDISTLSGLQLVSNVTSVLFLSDRILIPQSDGTSYLIGTFGSFSVSREIIIPTSLIIVTSITFQFSKNSDTLLGQQGHEADTIILDLMFNDGTLVNDIFSSGSNSHPTVVLFPPTDFFSLNTTTGVVTILDNSPREITYLLNAEDFYKNYSLFSNLEASNGDLDLGKEEDLPIGLPDGTTNSFTVPLRINSGRLGDGSKRGLGGVSGYISFDPSVFDVTAFTKNPSWPGDVLDVNIDSTPGRVSFSAPLKASESSAYASLTTDAVEIFSLTMNYQSGVVDNSNFSTEVVTFIDNMIDSNTPPQSIINSVEAIAGSFWIGRDPLGRTRRSLEPSLVRNKRQSGDCGGNPPPGDTDGDCQFTVADVTYALNYIVEAAANFPTSGDYYKLASQRQLEEMDPTLDGLINSNDPSYLNRIIVGFLPFVRDVVILSTHEFVLSLCRIKVEASIVDKDNSPIQDANKAAFYAGLFTTESAFQAEISALNPEPGFGSQVPSTDQETNFFGQFYRTEFFNNTHSLRLLPEFINDYTKTAVILAVATINSLGTTTAERVSTFFSSNVNPEFTSTFDKTITDSSLSVNVRKTNRFNPLRTISINLTYSECNNIATPNFTQSNYTGNVLENATIGVIILTVEATDPDKFTNAEIVYSFSSQTISSRFAIDSDTGDISVNGALDRETVDKYSFKVTASDKGISQVLRGEVDVIINVLDVNDNFPIFDQVSYGEFTFPEDTPLDTIIIQVSASDRDILNNGNILYSLDTDCLGYFGISAVGTISVVQEIDYENVQAFQCTIIASDQGYIPKSDTAYIDIIFTPLNDLAPQCPAKVEFSFSLDATFGHVVGIITAQDEDLGEDHNVLAYELVDSSNSSFGINQISNNQVELITNLSGYTTGNTFTVTLNITDRVWHYCVTEIRIFVEEASYFDFSFTPPKSAFFLQFPKYNFVKKAYEQSIRFFIEGRDTTPINVIAQRGGQTQNTIITKQPQTASSVVGVVSGSSVIYFDQPWIKVTAQFSSSSGSTYVTAPTSALIEVTSTTESLTITNSICSPGTLTDGICVGRVNFPSQWSDSEHSAEVKITLNGNEFVITTINFKLKPTIPTAPSENLMLSLPHFDIYPDDEFAIQLSAYTRYEPIGFEVEISYPISRLSTVGIPHYTTELGWQCSSSSTSDGSFITEKYSCNYANTDELDPGLINRFTDLLSLRFKQIGTDYSNFSITARGVSLVANNAVIYSVGTSTVDIHKYDLNGFGDGHPNTPSDPILHLLADSEIHVFGFAEDSEIINDLRILDLPTKTIDAGIGLRGVRKNPIREVVNLGFTDFSCTSGSPSVLDITGDCLLLLTRDVTITGSDSVSVMITQGSNSIATIDFRIWVPVLTGGKYITVSFSDNTLQPVGNCPGLYQQTRVRLHTFFETPTLGPISVYYSDFSDMTITILENAVAVYSNGIVSVNSSFSGTSPVTVSLFVLNNGVSVGEGLITVDPTRNVTLEVIKPEVFTELSLESSPSSISDLSTNQLDLRAKLTGQCNADLQPNYVSTKAVFSDGNTQVLDNLISELELKPYPLILRHRTSLTLEAYGSGSGPVEVCWKCSAFAQKCGETSVTCSIPPPDNQALRIEPSIIAFSGSIANLAGYPSVATITEISLTYGSDSPKDLRFDERTTIFVDDTDNLFDFNNSTLEFTPRTGTASGFAFITVTFSQAPNVVLQAQIQLVRHKEIQFTLSPFPSYPGSTFNYIDTLSKVSRTNVYQRGLLQAVLITTSLDLIPITDLASYATDTSILTIDASQVVTPVIAGLANITVNFNGLTEILTVTVTDEEVNLASIIYFQLNSGSLNKRLNESETLQLDIELTDGTIILNYFSYSYYGVNQRLVILNATDTRDSISVQQNGQVTIRDNHFGTVNVLATGGNNVEATATFSVNLIPEVGDFDLGRTAGIPFGPLSRGNTYTIPIRVAAGSLDLSSFDIEIEFEETYFEPTGQAQLFHTGNIAIESSIPSKRNIYKFVGVLDSPLNGLVNFGNFELKVKSDAPAGLTRIRLLIVELVDVTAGMITSSNTESVASDIEIQIVGNRRSIPVFTSRVKRETHRFRRTPGQLPCGRFGDVNEDGAFTVLDAQVGRNFLVSTTSTTPPPGLDVNQNGVVDINDVIYLIRGLAFSLPFLCNVTVYPVGENIVCKLRISIWLENSDGSFPPSSYTFPHAMIQHKYITASVNDWDASVVTFGAKSTPTPGSVSPLGGLWEAYPSLNNDGTYLIDVETALSANSIGVTVVILTANTQFQSPRSRFLSLYKPSQTFNFDQIPNYAITSVRQPLVSQSDSFIGASGGYDPFISFDNKIRSDLCRYTGQVYSVEEGKGAGVLVGLVGALTLGGSEGNYVIDNGVPPDSNLYFTTTFVNGSQQIATGLTIDAERYRLYTFDIVVAVDFYNTAGNALAGSSQRRARFNISVVDSNDNPPVFDVTQESFVYLENTPVGTVLFVFHATDMDIGTNGEISYSISRGFGKEDFFINSTTGELVVANPLDRERQFAYQLEILATDNGLITQLSADFNSTVSILDINDNVPTISSPSPEFSIEENLSPPKLLSLESFRIVDNDNGDNGTISDYILADIKDDKGSFVSLYLFQFDSQSQVNTYWQICQIRPYKINICLSSNF